MCRDESRRRTGTSCGPLSRAVPSRSASSATVGASKITPASSCRRSACCSVFVSNVACRDVPPSSKKSSWMPTRSSPSASAHARASVCSTSLRGAANSVCTLGREPRRLPSMTRSRLSIDDSSCAISCQRSDPMRPGAAASCAPDGAAPVSSASTIASAFSSGVKTSRAARPAARRNTFEPSCRSSTSAANDCRKRSTGWFLDVGA